MGTVSISVASDGTQGNGNSFSPSISNDGRYIAFASYADNLVPGDTNGLVDIFVYDRKIRQLSRVSTKGSTDTSKWEFVELPGGPDWYAVAAADLNNDGKDDLIWYNPKQQWNVAGVSLKEETLGDRQFLVPQQWFGLPSTDNWIPRGVGDFNRDGLADLMMQNQGSDSVGAFLMTSSGVINSNIAASWPGWVNLPSQAGWDSLV